MISSGVDHLLQDFPAQPLSTLPAEQGGPYLLVRVHGLDQVGQEIYCHQCNMQFSTNALLHRHGRETQHAPYRCRCGTTFSRLDVLRRHIHTFQPKVSYPCPHCKKHRGSRAFARLDHLTQHLRGYHNMESGTESDESQPQQPPRKRKTTFKCPHDTCSHSSGTSSGSDQSPSGVFSSRTFQTRGEFTKHLREVHNESIFPCPEIGCSRVGGKGFFREKDLLNHVKDHHSPAALEASAI
jgi:hypothetical protein